jgi:surfeit locus 1 family protein
MYAFALRPKWILSHVLVVALIITMVILGFWQLQRLDDRRERNDAIESRTAEPVVLVDDLVSPADPLAIGDELEYRIVEATGVYQPADEVLVRNRTYEGRPGYWVLTPLRLGDGDAVIVNRGWIPNDLDATPAPPAGQVRVLGMVQPTRNAEGLQRDDPAEGVLTEVARPDVARLAQQIPYPLLPVYIQLEGQAPPAGDLPRMLGRPELDEGSHFSYAMQWFIFTTIAVVGYPLVLRRVAQGESGDRRLSDIPEIYR